jgi:hypothetical protein
MMQLFWLRFLIEQPSLLALYNSEPFLEEINPSGLDRISRKQFLDELLPTVTKYVAAKRTKG